MSNTPETDAILERIEKGNTCDAIVIYHSRKLERDRNKWMDLAIDALANVGILTEKNNELLAEVGQLKKMKSGIKTIEEILAE